MNFRRAQPDIVRSIRHISLIKDWTRARRVDSLPHFSDFVPDERSGDSADLMIAEVHRDAGRAAIFCQSAGARVEQIFNCSMSGRYLRDVIDPSLSEMARPVWDACLSLGLPMCSILPLADRDGCPVTVEQIYLPYRFTAQDVDIVVAAMHAWSTEGRFAIQGLMCNLAAAPERLSVIIDPALAVTASFNDQIDIA